MSYVRAKQSFKDVQRALFAAPFTHEDHAQQVGYAARCLQAAFVIRKLVRPNGFSGWLSGANHEAAHPSYCSCVADEVG
jgi:hypothetical protein